MSKQVSAGVLFIYKGSLLMVKAYFYNGGCYDIPKGKIEKDESPEEAVIRECYEEANIKLVPSKLIDLGKHKYRKDKDIYLFRYDAEEFNFNDCKCNSYFEYNGQQYPEIASYRLSSNLCLLYPRLEDVLYRIGFKI